MTRLRWRDDWSECGRFAIQSEQIRGEPRTFSLMSTGWLGHGDDLSPEHRRIADRLGLDTAAHGLGAKTRLRMAAQQIADALDAEETP